MTELYSVFSNAFKEEVPVDNNHTNLFKAICNKQWGLALELLRTEPDEVEMWSSRTAHDGEIVWNRLPIHQACINRAPLDVVRALLEAYPQSVTATDLNRRLPIHYSVVYGGTVEVAELLINACPATINLPDAYGKTPLMCLPPSSPSGSDMDAYNKTMELLSTKFDGPAVKTFSGQFNAFDEDISSDQNSTDLFRAIKNKNWEKALKTIRENPSRTKEWTQHIAWDGEPVWRRLPIHEACINNAPIFVFQALMEAYREGTERTDLNERLPLHHAAVHGAKLEVIELLLRSYPASIEMEDSFGKTPVMCLQPASQSEFSTYCETMEALSRNPSYYVAIPLEYNKPEEVSGEAPTEALNQVDIEYLQEIEREFSATESSREAPSEDSKQTNIERIKELEFELERERGEKMVLNQKLEKSLTQAKVLGDILEQKTVENSRLRQSYYNLKRELAKMQVDVLSQGSIIDEEKMEILSFATTMTSFDNRSKPVDSIVVKERNLRNLRAEVKEREFIIEKALMRARTRSPVNYG